MTKTKVLPVIHVLTEAQALDEVAKAKDCDADGVFLINHSSPWTHLRGVFDSAHSQFPTFPIGVNCLDLRPSEMFEAFPDVDAIWVDNAGINERADEQPLAEQILEARKDFEGLYFGGVAFKYQRAVSDVERAASIATEYLDVVTTSGPATGSPASPDKVRLMKEAIGDEHPLAIASGVTPENVETFLPHVDYILCATGISDDFHTLNAERTKQLIEKVRDNGSTTKGV